MRLHDVYCFSHLNFPSLFPSFPRLCGIALPLVLGGFGPSLRGPRRGRRGRRGRRLALGEIEAVALLVDEDPHAEDETLAGFVLAKFKGDALTIVLDVPHDGKIWKNE